MSSLSQLKSGANYRLVAGIAFIVIALDQLSKQGILSYFNRGEVKTLIPGWFDLTLTFNYGAAFGLWGWLSHGLREVVLGTTILLALGVVGYFLRQPAYQNRFGQIALASILGGAVGNILDRLYHGAVVDFLDVHYGEHHWPAFNLADSAICMGVMILLLIPHSRTARAGLSGSEVANNSVPH